jgi:hypothetical protein
LTRPSLARPPTRPHRPGWVRRPVILPTWCCGQSLRRVEHPRPSQRR